MDPDSENNPTDQNNPPDSQDSLVTPPPSPGGVIKPSGSETPAQRTEVPPPVQPQNTQQNFADDSPPNNPIQDNNLPQPSISSNQNQTRPTQEARPSPNPALGEHQIFPPDSNSPSSSGGRSLNKRLLLIIITAVLLVLLIAGYVFGYYLPNKPENVYKTGLDRSGDAMQMILDKAIEQGTYDKFKKSEITATMDINYAGQNIKGDFTTKFDGSKLDTDLNASFPSGDSKQVDLGLSVLSQKADNKEFPDTYLNIRGVKALGADLFLPGIGKYDGKWLAVTSDYLQSLANEYGIDSAAQKKNTDNYPTFDEISSLIRDAYGVTNEYVLTSDPSKAVFVNKQYLGKEDVEGVGTYHYEVGLNKDNYKAYCEAVSNVFLSNQAYKKLIGTSDEQIENQKQGTEDDCQQSSDGIKDDDTFEMWVDSKYKLIKKVRIYSGEDKGEYYELGQNYNGGEEINLFFGFHSDKGNFDSKVAFTTDLNTGESSSEITFSGGKDESGKYDGKITVSAKPLSGDFEITKPSNTVNIEKVLKDIGINPKDFASLYGGASTYGVASPALVAGVNTQSNDALIKSNINSIYANLEVYYAENGYYPIASQLNSRDWRSANMPGLGGDAISISFKYTPSDCNANGCQKFVLNVKLSDGSVFEKTGSNN